MYQATIDSVVITYNSELFIEGCLDSLLQSGATVVVVDNGSSDGTVRVIRAKYPQVILIENGRNLGYSAAVNLGASATQSDVFVISNADVVYTPDSLHRLVSFVREHPDVGVAGPQLLFPDGTWQASYGDVPAISEVIKRIIGLTSLHHWLRRLLWPMRLDHLPKQVGFIRGAVMAIRRKAFDTLGGWDQTFHFYAEDTDFCSRLDKAGWRVTFVPSVEVMHVGGASSTRVDLSEKYFRQLVDSELLLLRREIPGPQISLLKHLERLNARQMLLAWRIARRIGPRTTKGYATERTLAFEHLVQIWTEECQRRES